MSSISGTRLGPYEIVSPIGAGGIGCACGRIRAHPREALRNANLAQPMDGRWP